MIYKNKVLKMTVILYTMIIIIITLVVLTIAMIMFNAVTMYISARYSMKSHLLRVTINGEPYYLGWDNDNSKLGLGKCSELIPIWFQVLNNNTNGGELIYLKLPQNCIYLSLTSNTEKGSYYVSDILKLKYNNEDSLSSYSKIKFENDDNKNQIISMNGLYLGFTIIDNDVKVQLYKNKPSTVNDTKIVENIDVSCSEKTFYCPSD